MRNAARLALAAAVATIVLPAAPANAMYCGLLQPVCSTVCWVGYTAVGAYCID